MTESERIKFLGCWNSERNHDSRVYISYDSTNKNCQAGDMEIAESGHSKDDMTKPVINVGLGYSITDREPLFYEEYPGSIVDISELKFMVDEAKSYGYKNIGFILDRGYFCRSNLTYMKSKGYDFVIMAKGSKSFINRFVREVAGTFETDRNKRIPKYKVYGTTIQDKLRDTEEDSRYIHVYYNEMKAAIDRENIETKIDRTESMLKK